MLRQLTFTLSLILSNQLFGLVGGEIVTQPTRQIYAGVVLIRVGVSEVCTATRIGERQLLTAAHCVVERQKGLQKNNEDVRVRTILRAGSVLPISDRLEQETGEAFPFSATIVSTLVPASFHYSSYDEGWLRPELAADVAVITVEKLPTEIKVLPLAKGPRETNSQLIKLGYGCESEEKALLTQCTSSEASQKRRLKSAPTDLVTAKEVLEKLPLFPFGKRGSAIPVGLQEQMKQWYLFSPGRYFNAAQDEKMPLPSDGLASLSYFDSGGPLLEVSPNKMSSVVGVNSKGLTILPKNGEIADRERVIVDLHTNLHNGAVREWLDGILLFKPDQVRLSSHSIFETLIARRELVRKGSELELIDHRQRPDWFHIKKYFTGPLFHSPTGQIKLTGCSLKLKKLFRAEVRLSPPKNAENEQRAELISEGEDLYRFKFEASNGFGFVHFVFEGEDTDKSDEEVCRLSLSVN